MGLHITPGFNQQTVDKYLKDQTGKIEAAIISRLQFVGEAFVSNARNNNTYKDETGNLRSSIGYVISKNGLIIKRNFKETDSGTDKATGVRKAQELARQIAGTYNKGFCLIGVAGMDYAAAVESKGYDVITNASETAKQDLQRAIASLNAKLGKL